MFSFGLKKRIEQLENYISAHQIKLSELDAELRKVDTLTHSLRGLVNRKIGKVKEPDEEAELTPEERDFLASLPESERQRLKNS